MRKAWTAGPWRVDERYADEFEVVGPRKGCTRYGVKNEWTLARVGNDCDWHQKGTEDEDRANARLIAAAPAMAEALENLLSAFLALTHECQFKEVSDARAALALATGGTK